MQATEYKKNWKVWFKEWLRGAWRDPQQFFEARQVRNCSCCGYTGKFVSAKKRSVREFRCPNCSSRPRDRQLALIAGNIAPDMGQKAILHIAPEWPIFRRLNGNPKYVGGDIITRRNANAYVDITKIGFEPEHFDILICNHVLEHVPTDDVAMAECARVLGADGLGFFSVPISDADDTWEPPADMPSEEVERICGWDHKRLYGRDFGKKLSAHGFHVKAVGFEKPVREKYRLLNECMYVASKSADKIANLEDYPGWDIQSESHPL